MCRLFTNIVSAVVLYGLVVWEKGLAANRKSLAVMVSVFRPAAARIARTYRTVFHTAATVLAGISLLDFPAREHTRAHRKIKILRRKGVLVTERIRSRIRLQNRQDIIQ